VEVRERLQAVARQHASVSGDFENALQNVDFASSCAVMNGCGLFNQVVC